MIHIDSSILKKSEYRKFIEYQLKENTYIIISVLKKMFDSSGKSISLPEKIDYHHIHISEYERLYCYKIKYYESLSMLTQYELLIEFFDVTNVYRLMFVANNRVTVECMYDEFIVFLFPIVGSKLLH